jgi:hypothetical protein
VAHIDNISISRERFGLFAQKLFIYFYFLCFFVQRKPSIIASTKHQQNVKTYKKIPLATNINKIIGVYTFANKINNSKIMLGKHKTKNKYRYNNKVSTLPLFQFIRCLAFLDALFLLYN